MNKRSIIGRTIEGACPDAAAVAKRAVAYLTESFPGYPFLTELNGDSWLIIVDADTDIDRHGKINLAITTHLVRTCRAFISGAANWPVSTER